MFIGTAVIKQAEITGQARKKQQSKLENLQNKAEDHQIKNQGRSSAENMEFDQFYGIFLVTWKAYFPMFVSNTFAEMTLMIKSQEKMRRRIKETKTQREKDRRINVQSK